MTQHTPKAIKLLSQRKSFDDINKNGGASTQKCPRNVCRYGKWGPDDRSLSQEKEEGETAPTGQHRKSAVLLVTLDELTNRQI